jgi:hypothetical protein
MSPPPVLWGEYEGHHLSFSSARAALELLARAELQPVTGASLSDAAEQTPAQVVPPAAGPECIQHTEGVLAGITPSAASQCSDNVEAGKSDVQWMLLFEDWSV